MGEKRFSIRLAGRRTVTRGKLADLDLLDGDPLADISNIKKISAVVVNGRLIDAAERQRIIDAEMAARKAVAMPDRGRGSASPLQDHASANITYQRRGHRAGGPTLGGTT